VKPPAVAILLPVRGEEPHQQAGHGPIPVTIGARGARSQNRAAARQDELVRSEDFSASPER